MVLFQMRSFFFVGCLISMAFVGTIRSSQALPFKVFDPHHEYECPSNLTGCSGLFRPHIDYQSEMELLNRGEVSLSARLQSLERAKKSILIQALIFTGDESGRYVAEILKKKKKEGLDIRIIVDPFSNQIPKSQALFFDLKQNNIEVEGYQLGFSEVFHEISIHERDRVLQRFHEKLWVVDGNTPEGIAIVGGLNVANEYFRTGPKIKKIWRDQDIIVRGPIVKDIMDSFNRNFKFFQDSRHIHWPHFSRKFWKFYNGTGQSCVSLFLPQVCQSEPGKLKVPFRQNKVIQEIVEQAAQIPIYLDFQPAKLRYFQNRPRFGESYLFQVYKEMIHSAEREILIANAYFLPDPSVVESLREAARRGVRVILLTNSPKTNDIPAMGPGTRYTFFDLLNYANQYQVKRLDLRSEYDDRFQIYEWSRAKSQEGTMHAKYAVFDRKAGIIGSYNFDAHAELYNNENAVVFESEKKAVELARYFFENDVSKSDRVSLSEAKKYHHPKNLIDRIKLAFSLRIRKSF